MVGAVHMTSHIYVERALSFAHMPSAPALCSQ